MSFFLLTIRWLDDRYHGLLDRKGPREWPPSPFRLFQALVAAVARRGELDGDVGRSLAWLQTLAPPLIIAPRSRAGQVVTRFVPNNDGDKKPDRQDRLTSKTSYPTIMRGTPEIYYLWPLAAETAPEALLVCQAARWLTCLGWGIDMAYANGRLIQSDEICTLRGVRWRPRQGVEHDSGLLRVPVCDRESNENTLCDLKRAHESALKRIEHGRPLNTVEKPRVFARVFYESEERPARRPCAVFELRNDDDSRFRYPQAQLIHIAGMVRHLAIEAMRKSPPEEIADPAAWVRSYVAGHRDAESAEHRQFSYLPLPSIGHAHTDPSVRRVIIAAPRGDDRLLAHLALLLSGERLIATSRTKLDRPPTLVRVRRDKVAGLYTEPASTWASVTPVILPGHDDHKPDKTRKLIETALRQSGVEQACEFEWSAISWFPQSLPAYKRCRDGREFGYIRPPYLQGQTAVHLRLRFNDCVQVPGPLVIGAGRHCGLGLLARREP